MWCEDMCCVEREIKVKKTAFLAGFIIIFANTLGMNNSSMTPLGNPQSNMNRRLVSIRTLAANNGMSFSSFERRFSHGINAMISPPASPHQSSVDIPYPFNATQNERHVAPFINTQGQSFFGHRMRNLSDATNDLVIIPQQSITRQFPQNMLNIASAPQQMPVQNVRRARVRTEIEIFVTTCVETEPLQPVPQHIGTYADNSVPNPTNSQPQNSDNSENGWLSNLYNSIMQPDPNSDSLEASTSKADGSKNEEVSSSDEYDNMPLSQTKILRKRKAGSIDAFCPRKKDKKS